MLTCLSLTILAFAQKSTPLVRGRRDLAQVALTIDDGPNPSTTPYLLKVFEKHRIRATFFLIGRRVKEHPELVRDIVRHGHLIANHSMTHPNLTQLSQAEVDREWSECSEAIREIVGYKPEFCRPPGGQANDMVLRSAKANGLRPVFWSLNAKDFDANDVETVLKAVLKKIDNGTIVLLHDKVHHTYQALDLIVPAVRDSGFEFVTVADLAEALERE